MSLDRDEILRRCDPAKLPRTRVSTPEWAHDGSDDHVYVRQMAASEFAAFRETLPDSKDDLGTEAEEAARWTVQCACNIKGERLFAAGAAAQLVEGPLAPLVRCAEAAIHINALDELSQQDLAKNLDGGPPADSLSS
jgi:hypothetical protein